MAGAAPEKTKAGARGRRLGGGEKPWEGRTGYCCYRMRSLCPPPGADPVAPPPAHLRGRLLTLRAAAILRDVLEQRLLGRGR
jgi:hypothetical protein